MDGMPRVVSLKEAADRYLEACFEKETPPHVAELALAIGVAASQLTRPFRTEVGVTPASYLKSEQIRRAQSLLRSTTLPMNAVGYQWGFGTRMSFFRAFRRATGLTPMQYRENAGQNCK